MDSNPPQVCRLCLLTSDNAVNIWETNGDSSIASILVKHFWFEVNKNDGLTEWLCQICWIQTKTFHEFYKKVEQYHKYLLDSVEKETCETHETVDGKDTSFEPYLDLVECETELKMHSFDSQISKDDSWNDSDDNNCDQSENEDVSDQSSVKNLIGDETELSEKETRDSQIRELFTMKCEICSNTQFDDLLHARRHYRIVHKTKGYLMCCGKKYMSRYQILNHIRDHSNPSARSKIEQENSQMRALFTMKCEICSDIQFQTLLDARRHYRNVHKTKGYLMCCGKKFWLRSEILHHIRYHRNPTTRSQIEEENTRIRELFTMKCETCSDVEFETLLDARRHYRKVHQIKGYIMCCGRKFWRRHLILTHILTHVNPDAFRCDQCGKSCRSRDGLKSHIANHVPLDSRVHKCSLCSSSFAKAALLKHHVINKHSSKTGEKFPCDKCGKNFRSQLLLACHIRGVHEYSLEHVCETCARRFKTKNSLENHIINQHSTTPQPKVQCNICGAWLKHETGLRGHMKSMHQEGEHEAVKCTICDKMVKNKRALRGHIQCAHGERRHQCVFCEKAFKCAKNLKEHTALHTGEDLYNCPYCEKKFKSNGNLYSHRKKAHFTEWSRDFPQLVAMKKNSTSE